MALPTSWTHALSATPELVDSISRAICDTHQAAFAASASPGEVDFVASLATAMPTPLSSLLLAAAGSGHGVRSLFLHQSPKTEFVNSKGATAKPELADLGLAVRCATSSGGWDGAGLLIQTKMAPKRARSSYLTTVKGDQQEL